MASMHTYASINHYILKRLIHIPQQLENYPYGLIILLGFVYDYYAMTLTRLSGLPPGNIILHFL